PGRAHRAGDGGGACRGGGAHRAAAPARDDPDGRRRPRVDRRPAPTGRHLPRLSRGGGPPAVPRRRPGRHRAVGADRPLSCTGYVLTRGPEGAPVAVLADLAEAAEGDFPAMTLTGYDLRTAEPLWGPVEALGPQA